MPNVTRPELYTLPNPASPLHIRGSGPPSKPASYGKACTNPTLRGPKITEHDEELEPISSLLKAANADSTPYVCHIYLGDSPTAPGIPSTRSSSCPCIVAVTMAGDEYHELGELPTPQPKIRFLKSPVATGLSYAETATHSRSQTGLLSKESDPEETVDFDGVPEFERVSCWSMTAEAVHPASRCQCQCQSIVARRCESVGALLRPLLRRHLQRVFSKSGHHQPCSLQGLRRIFLVRLFHSPFSFLLSHYQGLAACIFSTHLTDLSARPQLAVVELVCRDRV